jgi:hypothetical protein
MPHPPCCHSNPPLELSKNQRADSTDRFTRPKIVCSPSYADFRSRANAAMWLDLDHKKRGEHIWEI